MIQGRMTKLFIALMVAGIGSVGAANEQEYVPGEYVVVMKKNAQVTASVFQSSFRAFSAQAINKKAKTFLVKKSPIERADFAIAELESNPAVAFAEPNYIYRINTTPNDPMFGDLWGLSNNGDKDGLKGFDINAVQAWTLSKGSKDIIVGVIDTGVDYTHPDLSENIWVNEAELNGVEGVDDDNNGFVDDIHGYDFANDDGDPMDDNMHGTHVSGTIGARGDDGVGVVGVNWNVRIMALKFITAAGSGTLESAIKAIDYSIQMGAMLTSNSWGGGGKSQSLEAAIQRARDAGQLFVAAAGNSGKDSDATPMYPAAYEAENIISVAAVDRAGKLADFSNYGATSVDIGAPGVDVVSSTPNGKYKALSGTSMATPHVAGVVALLMAYDRTLNWEQVKSRLLKTSVPTEALRQKTTTGGMLNAYAALANVLPPPDLSDPANWPYVAASAETTHPYNNKSKEEWVFEKAGASQIALYFDRFELETNYDVIRLYNRQGALVETLSGTRNAQYTPPIKGDYVKVVFQSDQSVNKFGLIISRIAYVE